MEPFLRQVAAAFYADGTDLQNCCFVFPNRRSGSFFKKYMLETVGSADCILPDIQTISDFIASQVDLTEAGKMEQLFLLYDAYKELVPENKADFDSFLYWGDMILGDFNDVDRYMADAKGLFTNVKNLKELSSNYLTEAQIEVLRVFFGEEREYRDDKLWVDEKSLKGKYFKLWQLLNPLYCKFREKLEEKGLAYSGMIYRQAAERIESKRAEDFPFEKVIFVGFSTLSTSEERIFAHFKKLNIGDFYWDFNFKPFEDNSNKGTYFIKQYKKNYPSLKDVDKEERKDMPNIHVFSVPSAGGQAKVVGQILNGKFGDLKLDKANAIDTAIVLPDEKLLNSVLFSIPSDIESLNITMGYPLANTSIASFVEMLATLHGRKRVDANEAYFYYEDLNALLGHLYVKRNCTENIKELQDEIIAERLQFVPSALVREKLKSLNVIFDSPKQKTSREVVDYVDSILRWVAAGLNGTETMDKLEKSFVFQYLNSLGQLRETVEEYNVDITEKTFFYLLCRMLSGNSVTFEGEPLKGLQIMGVLETRLLDFRNLFVLSMNEKVFPSKHYTRSFIPNALRKAYALSTYEHQDAMFTYYFYRMLSRAENVFLLYDSRVQEISSGEESRYVSQLQKIYNRNKCQYHYYEYNIRTQEEREFFVEKTDRVWDKLKQFKNSEGEIKSLSPSRINTYIDCPLKFYLQHVEGLKEDEEMTDFIDSATFGNIIHKMMQVLYDSASPKVIMAETIDSWLNNKAMIEKLATRIINEEYCHLKSDLDRELVGDTILIGKIVLYYVRQLLKYDKRIAPFEYKNSELASSKTRWLVGTHEFNYRQVIDRIDCVLSDDGDYLRIVDYKTGTDTPEVNSVDDLFDDTVASSKRKALTQLMLYCNFYVQDNVGYEQKQICPVVYKVRDVDAVLVNGNTFDVKIGKQTVTDYRDYNKEFMGKFTELIAELFDRNKPFVQTKNIENCKYCPFVEICGRDC